MAKNNKNNPMNLTPEEIQSELAMLRNSYDMYERTKQETIDVRTNKTDKNGNKVYSEKSLKDTLKLMETMEADIKEKYIALGGNPDDLVARKKPTKKALNDRKAKLMAVLEKERKRDEEEMKLKEQIESNFKPNIPDDEFPTIDGNDDSEEEYTTYAEHEAETKVEYAAEEDTNIPQHQTISIDASKMKANGIKYDVIPLPSKGECYKQKMKSIPVSYLTAYDEDLIMSPNLYRDGTFLDYMLKSKVMTNEIDTDDLIPGDRDAIILWLRGSGYGPEYEVNAYDEETGQSFKTVIDLSKIPQKPFKLKGDTNGYFAFKLPVSGDVVKFKFLSYKDLKTLEHISEIENAKLKKDKLMTINSDLKEFVENETDLDRVLKNKLSEAMKTIDEYEKSIDEDDDILFGHFVTNKLTMSIMSVNGITDRKYIEDYVKYMTVKDSSALRKYINENEPGFDYNITVEKPASLGGGSITFPLKLDQFIFLYVAQ